MAATKSTTNTELILGAVQLGRRAVRWVVACALLAACSDEPAAPVGADASVAQTDAAVGADGGVAQLPASLAVSPTHACAVRKAGVYCWGENFLGQLGNGNTTTSAAPVAASVVGKDIVEIAAATGRTCIRTSKGTIECWGGNDHGQIGDGTQTDTFTPVAAKGIDDAIALALDDVSTCVIRKAGRTVACWGGGPEDAWVPRTIEGLANIVELRAGSDGSYCARDASSIVSCWTSGNGAWEKPRTVDALMGAKAVAVAGFDEVCALVKEGNIVCNSSDTGRSVPLDDSYRMATITAAGSLAVCGRKLDGSWWCWNVLRQMLEDFGSPAIAIPTDQPFSELLLSGFNVCALRADNQVVCANANEILISLMGVEGNGLKVVEGLPE